MNEPLPGANRVLVVPQDCIFVVGDNLEASVDSRNWNDPFVNKGDVKAKSILRTERRWESQKATL